MQSMDRTQLLELYEERKAMEEEIDEIIQYLTGPASGSVGLSGGLVDAEGFPSEDTEKVITVREKRNRLAVLRTDLKSTSKLIEDGLLEMHNNSDGRAPHEPKEKIVVVMSPVPPFATISDIRENSPAHEAGLCNGDQLLRLNGESKLSKAEFAKIINACTDRSIPILIQRDAAEKELVLRPHKWDGQGVLGMMIHFL